MVALAIIVAAIIVAGAITRGMKLIEMQLAHIKQNLLEIKGELNLIKNKQVDIAEYQFCTSSYLRSLKRILARNFRIAFNDEEFENL